MISLTKALLMDRRMRALTSLDGATFVKLDKRFTRGFPRPGDTRWFTRPARMSQAPAMKSDDMITVDPDILGGSPVFKGTRVPVKTLFEYLEDNHALEEFLECFPSVTREMAWRILERSERALLSPAAA